MLIPVPADEAERLNELQELGLIEAGREAGYDDLVQLLSQWCEVPMAAVTLLDAQTQWLKARVGLDMAPMPRSHSFCTHPILAPRGWPAPPPPPPPPAFPHPPPGPRPPTSPFLRGRPPNHAPRHDP